MRTSPAAAMEQIVLNSDTDWIGAQAPSAGNVGSVY
jgi:hypothetical protein